MRRSLTPALLLAFACGGDKGDTFVPIVPTDVTDSGTLTTATGTTTSTTSTTSVPTGTTSTSSTTRIDFCPPWSSATGKIVTASPGDDLQLALDGLSAGDTLSLADGTYALAAPLSLDVDNVTLRSASGDRTQVTLTGEGLSEGLLQIEASGVVVTALTLTGSAGNAVTYVPTYTSIAGGTLYDLAIVDNAQYGVTAANNLLGFVDQITVACSDIRLTDTGRANVVGSCQTAGIEVLQGQDWVVHDNTVDGFFCDQGLAHGGIRFWQGSRGTRIERNRVLDSRRGIVVGVGTTLISRAYADLPCGGERAQHFEGVVINNFVSANNGALFASFSPPPDGIALENSCDVSVLHNSVRHNDPPIDGSIVHRHPLTSGLVANNLSTGSVARLDGSTASSTTNAEIVTDTYFDQAPTGDLHLTINAIDAIDACDPAHLKAVPEDIDGQPRTGDPDCGADETTP